MKTWIVNEVQGTPEWHSGRKTRKNASELACVLGIDPKGRKRSDLVRERATGIEREFSDYMQERVLNRGHEIEQLARPIVERRIGTDLYPVVYAGEVDGVVYGASLDGITDDDTRTFECKSSNAELRAAIAAGNIPVGYKPQMEQGLWLTGAEMCLFTVSDGTDDGTVSCEYRSDPALRARIIPAWKEFDEDVKNYVHVDVTPEASATPIKGLPAVVITASGSLAVTTNFARWGVELKEFIARVPVQKPKTSKEIADYKAAIAAFKQAESMLDSEEKRVLSMVESIEDMQREKKLLRDLSSTTRLHLEKLLKQGEIDIKSNMLESARTKYSDHIAALNKRIGGAWMPPSSNADFAQAIKGKSSYENMQEAVDNMLRDKSWAANLNADLIDANRKSLTGEAHDWMFLFPDFPSICLKPAEDFAALLAMRVTNHKAAEDKRMEAEREKIRAEEKAKAEAEAEAKVKVEEARIRAEEQAKAKAEQAERDAENARMAHELAEREAVNIEAEKAQVSAAPEERAKNEADALSHGFGAVPSTGIPVIEQNQHVANASIIDEGKMMKLGDIASRLGFNVTAEFVGKLGFHPVGIERSAKLYKESDFARICNALIDHINSAMHESRKAA